MLQRLQPVFFLFCSVCSFFVICFLILRYIVAFASFLLSLVISFLLLYICFFFITFLFFAFSISSNLVLSRTFLASNA